MSLETEALIFIGIVGNRLLGTKGCRHINNASGTVTVPLSTMVIQEDTTQFSALVGSDGINYLTLYGLTGINLKAGSLIPAPLGVFFKSTAVSTGSVIAYL